jgi:hypothetical protein
LAAGWVDDEGDGDAVCEGDDEGEPDGLADFDGRAEDDAERGGAGEVTAARDGTAWVGT